MRLGLSLGLTHRGKIVLELLPFSWGLVTDTWAFFDTETWDDLGA